jgi:hypothetical protein
VTLTRLLEIDRRIVRAEALDSLLYAERIWNECGCPAEGPALADALETILQRCAREAVYYAPILLQRKKALERGTWKPRAGSTGFSLCSPRLPHDNAWLPHDVAAAATAAPGSGRARGPAPTGEPLPCAACGGTGIVVGPGGRSGSLCACGAWRRSRHA